MELRHLRYLVAIAEEQSFLQAGRRLRVAQSALSKQIQDLEREIGIKLFHRAARGVRLTVGGKAFLKEARSTLENADRAVASARQAQESADRVLRFGHGTLGSRASLVLQFFADFRGAFPGSDVEIHHLDETGQRTALLEHEIDLAATWLVSPIEEAFGCLPLLDCSCPGVLLPADHPLATQEQLHLADLAELTMLHPATDSWPAMHRATMRALAERGLVVTRGRPMPPDYRTATLDIATGRFWALANESHAATICTITPAIVYRTFVEPPVPLMLALIWHQESPSPWVESVLEIARRHSQVSLVA